MRDFKIDDRIRLRYKPNGIEITGVISSIVHSSIPSYLVRYDQEVIPPEDWHEAKDLELLDDLPQGLDEVKCKCGTNARKVKSGFTNIVEIWWCDNCRDEV